MEYNKQTKGTEETANVTVGKAEGVVDCTAEEVVAWFFDFCSNDSTKMSHERGDLARLEIARAGETRANEKTIATIEKSLFPFRDREYVSKLIWKVNSDDLSFSVAIWPVPDVVVDYGDSLTSTKIVRAELKGIFTATNIGSIGKVKQCKVTYHQVSEQGRNSYVHFDLTSHILTNTTLTLATGPYRVSIQ